MSCWLFIAILALARGAAAQDQGMPEPQGGPVVPPDAEELFDAHQRLELAVRAYQAGNHEEARTSLALLVNDPRVSDAVLRQHARIYLGEILYVQGQEDAAFKVFETVLLEDQSFKVDPFMHPPDVCGFFEVVRASVSALAAETIPAPPPPSSRFAWAGFGAWQRAQGNRRFGNLLMSGQVILGAVSMTTHAMILSDRTYTLGTPEETRILALRAVQWTSTAGFWGLYAWGTLDAREKLRAAETGRAEAAPPVGIGVSGRW